MKKLNLTFKNPVFWVMVYNLAATITIIVLSVKLGRHECPAPNIPEIQKKYVEQIKEISHADSDDIDSLLLELYGLESK